MQSVDESNSAEVMGVHNLESLDYACLPKTTYSLREYVRRNSVKARFWTKGFKGERKSCLEVVVRHFVEESLRTGKVQTLASENCAVSVGMIKGTGAAVVESLLGKSIWRPRKFEKEFIFCFFIPIATVQFRFCLLSRLTLEELSSVSSETLVDRIDRGDIGYYVARVKEHRVLPKIADIQLSFSTATLEICEEEGGEALLALFPANSPFLALCPLRMFIAIAFLCCESDFEKTGASAFPCISIVKCLKMTDLKGFLDFYSDEFLPIIVIDVQFLGGHGITVFQSELHRCSFPRPEFRPEVVGIVPEDGSILPPICGYSIGGPMTVPSLQSSVLTAIVERRIRGPQ